MLVIYTSWKKMMNRITVLRWYLSCIPLGRILKRVWQQAYANFRTAVWLLSDLFHQKLRGCRFSFQRGFTRSLSLQKRTMLMLVLMLMKTTPALCGSGWTGCEESDLAWLKAITARVASLLGEWNTFSDAVQLIRKMNKEVRFLESVQGQGTSGKDR